MQFNKRSIDKVIKNVSKINLVARQDRSSSNDNLVHQFHDLSHCYNPALPNDQIHPMMAPASYSLMANEAMTFPKNEINPLFKLNDHRNR